MGQTSLVNFRADNFFPDISHHLFVAMGPQREERRNISGSTLFRPEKKDDKGHFMDLCHHLSHLYHCYHFFPNLGDFRFWTKACGAFCWHEFPLVVLLESSRCWPGLALIDWVLYDLRRSCGFAEVGPRLKQWIQRNLVFFRPKSRTGSLFFLLSFSLKSCGISSLFVIVLTRFNRELKSRLFFHSLFLLLSLFPQNRRRVDSKKRDLLEMN